MYPFYNHIGKIVFEIGLEVLYIKRNSLRRFVDYLSRRSTGKDHCLAELSRLFYSGSESQQFWCCDP